MADGTIYIDTRIDTSRVGKGVKSIVNSFNGVLRAIKGIGKALVLALSGGFILGLIQNIAGSFNFLSSSIGDKFKPLADALGILKGAFINLIATALVPLIPYIVIAVQWLTNMLFVATELIAALFGMKKTMGGIATETKKATKETKGALAAFDQINVLQKQDSGGEEETPFITPEAITVSDKMKKFVDEFLQKIQVVKDILAKIFDNPLLILNILKLAWQTFVEWIRNNLPFGNVIADILDIIGGTIGDLFNNAVETLTAMKEKVILIFQGIKDFITGVFTGDWRLAWQGIQEVVAGVLGFLLVWIQGWINQIKIYFGGLVEILKVLFAPIADKLREAFGIALEWIKTRFETIFNSIADIVKGVANQIIDFINSMIEGVVSGINSVVNSVNAVGTFIPEFQPLSNVSAPRIPRLATGAVIPPNAEFMAILGDQRGGKNIEAPADLIRQIVREETGNMQANIQIGFSGSLSGLVRELKPYIDKENVRIGGSLIRSSVNT